MLIDLFNWVLIANDSQVMGKMTIGQKHKKWLKEEKFKGQFKSDGAGGLYCLMCERGIDASKKSLFVQHWATKDHGDNCEKKALKGEENNNMDNNSQQQMLTEMDSSKKQYSMLVVKAWTSANIPYNALNNKHVRKLLATNSNGIVPSESSVRQTYMPRLYDETIDMIRKELKGKKIWCSIDEASDATGRFIACFVVGELSNKKDNKAYLFNMKALHAVNYKTISNFFNDSIDLLWGLEKKRENVLLFTSDNASYMVKAADHLKVDFPRLIHITCLAHGIHRLCEEVRKHFKLVDHLISNIKKVFLKSPYRNYKLKEMFPNLSKPPEPIITRWGTWINAALYYAENFDKIKSVIDTLDESDATSISVAKSLLNDSHIREDLSFISTHLKFLPPLIESLEAENESLVLSISKIDAANDCLRDIGGEIGMKLRAKMKDLIGKNEGLRQLNEIKKIIAGDDDKDQKLIGIEYDVNEIELFNYSPINSCHCERVFSKLKDVLSDKRQRFTIENLIKTLICNYNH